MFTGIVRTKGNTDAPGATKNCNFASTRIPPAVKRPCWFACAVTVFDICFAAVAASSCARAARLFPKKSSKRATKSAVELVLAAAA